MDACNVPVEYSYRWILCAIEVSKKYYSLFLGCGMLMLVSSLAISFIPIIGVVTSAMMTYLYALGTLRLVRQIMLTEKATFDDFLKYTFDPIVFEKFAPFLVIVAVANMITVGLNLGSVKFVLLPWGLIANVTLFICSQASYMMLLKPELQWKDALNTILKGTWMNIMPMIGLFICTVIFTIGSLMMCLVGFFLYFIPMTMPLNYLVFSSIYEGLDIMTTTATWSSKAQAVQTLSVPADEP